MINEHKYVTHSLELHLFFGRIMKEHSIFLEAGFTPANAEFSKVADQYKQQFENVLNNAVHLGNGVVSESVVSSGEIITDYTLGSELKTQHFTGIAINEEITRAQARMVGGNSQRITPELVHQVRQLNQFAIQLVDGLIEFKTGVLEHVLSCNMFTANYPLLIEHILREAKMYKSELTAVENGEDIDKNIKETELFWDQIMMEHALFIRGLLDPSENALIQTSDQFAKEYADLMNQAKTATDMTIASVTGATLRKTIKYRDFKAAGTEGIADCKIRSIILPLLGDHVLREANHYIRLLGQYR